jgi:bacteriocin-type transport-associated protein
MTEVLLEQLSNSDLEWIRARSRPQEVAAGSTLIQQQSQVDCLYLILEGTFAASIGRSPGSALGRAFAALEDEEELEQEIGRFSSGDILGEMSFLDAKPSLSTVKAVENSLVMALPCQDLLEKFQTDLGFAARFYRALAILLSERFQGLLKLYLQRRMGQVAPLQDVPLIFGELSDSDVDWLLSHGHLEAIDRDTVLLRMGRPVEELYVLIQGSISVIVSEQKRNRLTSVFARLEREESSEEEFGREIGRISRGEMIGEVALLESHLSNATLKTLEDSTLLAIPRQQLVIKLEQDPGMASRFYRVVAMLLSGRLQGLISRLGFGRSSYRRGERLSLDRDYEDEISLEVMDNLTLGGARFDWMLRRLRVS